MSARPKIEVLEPPDLDLLISRSLDGDLSPEDRNELDRHLAVNPKARLRRDEMAELVRELSALEPPAPPFALATRVNARVVETSAGLAGAFHRFGFYPKGWSLYVGTAAALVVLITSTVLLDKRDRAARLARQADSAAVAESKRAKATSADSVEGRPQSSNEPLQVFFEKKPALRDQAGPDATQPETRIAGAAPNEADAVSARAPAKLAKEREAVRAEPAGPALDSEVAAAGKPNDAASVRLSEAVAANEAPAAAAPALPKVAAYAPERPAGKDEVAGPGAERSLSSSRADAPAGVVAQAAREALSVAAWMPDRSPSPWTYASARVQRDADADIPPLVAVFRLRIDSKGEIREFRRLSVTPSSAAEAAERLLKGLRFTRNPASNASPEAEIEVEIRAR